MSFCILHLQYKTQPIIQTESLFALYSPFKVILSKLNEIIKTTSLTEETVFCHIPTLRIIPNWDDPISTHCEESAKILIEIYPIQSSSVIQFHNEYSTVILPSHLQHFIDEEKQRIKRITIQQQSQSSPLSPRMKITSSVKAMIGRTFNAMIVQKPSCSYTKQLQHLITIKTGNIKKDIPALWYKASKTTTNQHEPVTLLYFHDYNEDLGLISQSLKVLCETMHCNILAFEYPSYGIYEQNYSDETLANNSDYVYSYLTMILKKQPDHVIFVGKGIGAAIALKLASTKKSKRKVVASGVILISPKMDPSSFGKGIFENKKTIKNVSIPVFCLSGSLDKNCCDLKKLQNLVKSPHDFVKIEGASDDLEDLYFGEYTETLSSFIVKLFPEYSHLFSGKELENAKPNQFKESPIEIVTSFLKQLHLEQYTEMFICFGYISIDDIMSMQDEEIDMIGMEEKDSNILKEYMKKKRLQVNRFSRSESLQQIEFEGSDEIVCITPDICSAVYPDV